MARVNRTALTLLAAAALSVGCGDDLDPAWKIKTFRVFGVRVENTTRAADPRAVEAAPGETVRLTVSYLDPAATPRDVRVVWVMCAQARRMGATVGCDPAGASVLMGGAEQSYTVPSIAYGLDPFGRARITAIGVVCAGGAVAVDPATRLPSCTGAGAEGVTLTRSILVRASEADAMGHNPEITEAVLYRGGNTNDAVTLAADGSARVPRCTTDPCTEHVIELRAPAESRESYRTFDNAGVTVTRPERVLYGYFTTGGELDLTFYVDTAERPLGPVRNKWSAPRTPGTVTFIFSAQDTRGGYDWIQRTITVE